MDDSAQPTLNQPNLSDGSVVGPSPVTSQAIVQPKTGLNSHSVIPTREAKVLGGRQMQPQAAPRSFQPISAPSSKEHEPVPHTKLDVDKMTEPEIIEEEKAVEREINEIIKESPDVDKPKLPVDVQKAGVELAKDATPMPASPTGKVVLPMTYEEALATRKKFKWKDSISWIATALIYHFKKMKRDPKDVDTSGFG